jgi:NAD+ diphosphatase
MTHRFIDLPPEALGFAQTSIDRADKYRDNAAFLEDARSYGTSLTLVFIGDMPLIMCGNTPLNVLFTFNNVPFATDIGEPIFLGLENGNPRFAIVLPEQCLPELSVREDVKAVDLRTLAVKSLVTPQHLNLLATAQALLNWHGKHKFCANCGQKTKLKSAGWKRICDACQSEHFPRTDPVVIMMATYSDKCLLGRSKHFPQGMYSCLAGFVEPGESVENAVRREIMEETSIKIGSVAYHHSQPWPFPTSLMIGCLGQALSDEIKIDGLEIEDARWFSKLELAQIMNGTHKEGITAPTKMSIANHLMQAFLDF